MIFITNNFLQQNATTNTKQIGKTTTKPKMTYRRRNISNVKNVKFIKMKNLIWQRLKCDFMGTKNIEIKMKSLIRTSKEAIVGRARL